MNEQQVLTLREAEIATGLTVNARRWRAARLGWLGPRSWVARGRHQEMPGALEAGGMANVHASSAIAVPLARAHPLHQASPSAVGQARRAPVAADPDAGAVPSRHVQMIGHKERSGWQEAVGHAGQPRAKTAVFRCEDGCVSPAKASPREPASNWD